MCRHADIRKSYIILYNHIYNPILVIHNLILVIQNLFVFIYNLILVLVIKKNMAENSGRYSHILSITLITLLFILLGFTGEILKHQTRQIRYTRSQLLKIGKTFYKTKINDMPAITIRNLGIRQTFRPPRRPPRRDNRKKRGKRGGKKHARPWDTN